MRIPGVTHPLRQVSAWRLFCEMKTNEKPKRGRPPSGDVPKKRVTLTIDVALAKKARELGINISRACQERLIEILGTEADKARLSDGKSASDMDIGHVYFLRNTANGFIKIGFTSNDPSLRRSSIQSEAKQKMEPLGAMPGTYGLEQSLHQTFQTSRVAGEWFRPTAALLEYIGQEAGGNK